MARPYYVVMVLLLLVEVSRLGGGASNPGFVARITRKGLEYGKRGAHYCPPECCNQEQKKRIIGLGSASAWLRNIGYVTLWASFSLS